MLTETSLHRCATRCVFVNVFLEVLSANDLNLLSLNSKVASENATSYSSAVPAVAKVTSAVAGEQFSVVHFHSDGATETVALHV